MTYDEGMRLFKSANYRAAAEQFASGAFVEDAFTSPGWQLTDGNLHARFATVGAGYQVETYR